MPHRLLSLPDDPWVVLGLAVACQAEGEDYLHGILQRNKGGIQPTWEIG
jgi:hypothetical protein